MQARERRFRARRRLSVGACQYRSKCRGTQHDDKPEHGISHDALGVIERVGLTCTCHIQVAAVDDEEHAGDRSQRSQRPNRWGDVLAHRDDRARRISHDAEAHGE